MSLVRGLREPWSIAHCSEIVIFSGLGTHSAPATSDRLVERTASSVLVARESVGACEVVGALPILQIDLGHTREVGGGLRMIVGAQAGESLLVVGRGGDRVGV